MPTEHGGRTASRDTVLRQAGLQKHARNETLRHRWDVCRWVCHLGPQEVQGILRMQRLTMRERVAGPCKDLEPFHLVSRHDLP